MIIKRDKSIMIACDVDIKKFEDIVKETANIEEVSSYKIGFYLGLKYGLPKVVKIAREYTSKPLVYDHQKAATDIPETGSLFAEACASAGIDAVILFPQAGPETEKAWIDYCKAQGLGVIVGGLMTHKAYRKSEGGFLDDQKIYDIYTIAAKNGINDFVVPGNKPDEIKKIKSLVESAGAKPVFYAPGFIAQGGEITEAAKAAGERWHAIVGRAVYSSQDIKKTISELTKML
ncbi:MAG: orotidine 5'-phosphate decarboxylase / HUMPS family protein [Candidatus Bilamarchaeaceae archaeon]